MDHVEGEGANRKFIIVLGWSKKLVEASVGTQNAMTQSRVNEGKTPAAQQAPPSATTPNNQTRTRSGDLSNF